MDDDFPSEQEFFDGVRKDGRPLKYPSAEFTPKPTKLFSTDPAEPPVADAKPTQREKDAAQLHYEIDQRLAEDYDSIAHYGKRMMQLGLQAMEDYAQRKPIPAETPASTIPPENPASNGRESGVNGDDNVDAHQGAEPAAADATPKAAGKLPTPREHFGVAKDPFSDAFRLRTSSRPDKETPAGTIPPENPASNGRESGDDTPATEADAAKGGVQPVEPAAENATPKAAGRVQAPRGKGSDDLKISQCIALGQQGAKLLASVAEQRAAIAHKLVEQANKLDVRDTFMQDRAVAVIYTLMLHLDKEFQEMGFGAWMPFRWPDQWIGFCGVLTRVLAANGLIHGKHAETYRKLLEESPAVGFKGTLKDRIRESKTPEPMGKCKSVQGARTMSELREKVKASREHREAIERYWDTPKIPKPETG